MPRLDYCHLQIVRALEKEGWKVEADPFKVVTAERTVIIDLEASRQLNGHSQQVMVVEIKCFPNRKSTTNELYIAIGQYMMYHAILTETNLRIPLFLAVPDWVYSNVFDSYMHYIVRQSQIKLLVVNLETETVIKWIE